MRRLSTILITVALVLGLAQCKKEQPTPQSEGVMITLNVGDNNNGSRANVNPTGTEQVTFVDGDQILVAYDGHYVGTLEKATVGSVSQFSGTINITQSDTDQPLYFYFLGNKQGTLATGATTCTVNISDQTTTAGLPVISMGKSIDAEGETVYYESGMTSFSSRLYNKCSLMKFNVTTLSTAAICITDMNNKVTVDFGKYDETGTGLEGSTTNNGFSYSKDGSGMIKMPGVASSGASTWAIVLPQAELTTEGEANSVYTTDGYAGIRPRIHEITSNCYYNGDHEDDINLTLTDVSIWDGDLSKLTNESTPEFATARDGMTIYNELTANVKVSIADGATVTLNGVTINGENEYEYEWAGITCVGDATIILSGENTVKGFLDEYPGIFVPENSSLIINGTGSLDASSNGWASGIGAGYDFDCGNIEIRGGIITATGGEGAAGIGSGPNDSFGSTCGTITISGGTVTANGGDDAAGIGCGSFGTCGDISISGGTIFATGAGDGAGIGCDASGICGNISITGGIITATGSGIGAGIGTVISSECGTITIANTVTSVTATKGLNAANSIGKGTTGAGTCVAVKFGGQTMYDGSSWTTTPTNGGTYGGLSLAITTDEYDAITWTLTPVSSATSASEATTEDIGKIIGADGNIYADVASAVAAGTTANAIIAYVGGDTGESDYTHGLAISMKDADIDATYGGYSWASGWDANEMQLNTNYYEELSDALAAKESGLTITNGKLADANPATKFPAFYAAGNNSITTTSDIGAGVPTGTSGWFMPSIFQWQQILQGLSGETDALGENPNSKYTGAYINGRITNLSSSEYALGSEDQYWSSSESKNTQFFTYYNPWHYNPGSSAGYAGKHIVKSSTQPVRAVIAF